MLAIKHAINTIAENPGVGHPTGKGATRGIAVGRYPYIVYWTIERNGSCPARRARALARAAVVPIF